MIHHHCDLGFILIVILSILQQTTTVSINEKLKTYEQYVNTSRAIEQQDKVIICTWNEDYQVKLVDVTTKYRLLMTSHQQHSFMSSNNEKWLACLFLYENSITKLEQAYYLDENQCLKNASIAGGDKKQAVMQYGREIRKWRRTYRYLTNVCHKNHPDDDDESGVCLMHYMERDNYSHTFQRLINLRSVSVQALHQEMHNTLIRLEECLETALSAYLEQVRATMDVLSRCYGETEE